MTATMQTLGPPMQLTEQQRDHYFEHGYVLADALIDTGWMQRLQDASDEFVELSRQQETSDRRLDVEPDHSAENPRLRRLLNPVDNHPTFAEFALAGPAAQIAQDLLGSPARFHHSKLNYKWADGGQAVDWHQDIQYWPHTDFTPLTIGIYLDDVDERMGPMGIVPGSHRGELFDLYGPEQKWTGSIRETDLGRVDLDNVDWLMGPAGSVTVHNCGAVHGSTPNNSDRVRPLLLQTYSAAGSYPLVGVGANGRLGTSSGQLVGDGAAPDSLTVQGRTMVAAPDWSRGGYTTIFAAQGGEDATDSKTTTSDTECGAR